ncbi:group II intron reverse transcriptase/maturase [Anaerohalosphaera lusitana]
MMHEHRKSDSPIVPETLLNKDCDTLQSAERAEGRGLTKGNPSQQNRCRTQSRAGLQSALERIRQAAAGDNKLRFTSLWHHVYNVERLREEYFSIKRQAAAGVDEKTWQEYGEDLEENLQDLSSRLKRGAYRAKPVKRVYIPKSDGRQRPIGITTIEDKIVQRATTTVLNAIYETDFKGFSYGFRPGRSAHNALDAVTVGILKRKVNWVLDADICGFFDAIDHSWLIKFIEHWIGDQRVIRHIKKWLNAGVLEEGRRVQFKEGTPQGGSISPLLANIYLHYVFDLWAHQWRKRNGQGHVIMVRYADDIVVGFQYKSDAMRFRKDMQSRFCKFNLELHSDKTRLIQFGRFAAERRAAKGQGKPETFDFLGFTHICAKSSKGTFKLLRLPIRKRVQAKLKEIKEQLKIRRYTSIPEMGRWLHSVVSGWYRYYAVPNTFRYLGKFRRRVAWLWFRALRRRSQRSRMTWSRMYKLMDRWLPKPRILHAYPQARLKAARYDPRQEPYAVIPHVRICAGGCEQSQSLPRPHF